LSTEDLSGIYYFKFLDKRELITELSSKLQIEGVNFATKTIGLSFKDRNPARATAIVSTVAEEFIEYALEDKREGIMNILHFIETQIDTFATAYDKYQDSIIALRVSEGYLGNEGSLLSFSGKLAEYDAKFRDYKYDITQLARFDK
jgi:hypothetical protein